MGVNGESPVNVGEDLGHLDEGRGPDAYVRPDDLDLVTGVRTCEDKVDNLVARIEARESYTNDMDSSLWWYLTLVGAFIVGSLMSGASISSGGGGSPELVGLLAAMSPVGVREPLGSGLSDGIWKLYDTITPDKEVIPDVE